MMKLDSVASSVIVRDDGFHKFPAQTTVHNPADINKIERIVVKLEQRENKKVFQESLYYCKETLNAAKVAADSVMSAVCEVLDEESPRSRSFCIVRPPGHHAHAHHHHGFCFFNNVALGA